MLTFLIILSAKWVSILLTLVEPVKLNFLTFGFFTSLRDS